jgi:hypothetical protein
MPYPRDYTHIATCAFPDRQVWTRDADEGSVGPFTAVGLLVAACHSDPDAEHTRYHVVLVGTPRPSVPFESVIWTEIESKKLRADAVARRKAAEAAEKKRVEDEKARRIAEAEAVLAEVKSAS